MTLQHTATRNTLQHTAIYTATHGNTLQHTCRACQRNPLSDAKQRQHISLCTLQHTATHCNTLQHMCLTCQLKPLSDAKRRQHISLCTLQHTATRCTTLQHPATPVSYLSTQKSQQYQTTATGPPPAQNPVCCSALQCSLRCELHRALQRVLQYVPTYCRYDYFWSFIFAKEPYKRDYILQKKP